MVPERLQTGAARALAASIVALGFVGALAAATGGAAFAHPEDPAAATDDQVPTAPKAFDGVGLTEKPGAQVPLDLAFRDTDGKPVTLRDLVRGDLPTILTFNYSNCPMLCSMQLNGLVNVLQGFRWTPGKQFRIVTVVIEPKETPAGAAKTRAMYLDRLPESMRASAAAGGWTFVVAPAEGQDASIRRLAETVGFGYKYVPERAEWAHPAALIFLSANGKVIRYVGDVNYNADVLTESIVAAGTAEPLPSVGFVMACFHYDADTNNYSRFGVNAMRYGAAGFVVLLLVAFGAWRVISSARRRSRLAGGAARPK